MILTRLERPEIAMKFTKEVKEAFAYIDNWCYGNGHPEVDGGFVTPSPELYKWLHEVGLGSQFHWSLEYHLEWQEFDIAKWLIDSGCPMTKDTMNEVAGRGNLEAAEWLMENGCPWKKEELLLTCQRNRYEPMVEWVQSLPD